MLRKLRSLFMAASVLLAVAVAAAPASAAKGEFSIGGNVGVGFYSMGEINDALVEDDFEEISSGMEFGGSLRYQVSERAALDLEVNRLNPKSTTEDPGFPDIEFSAPALAIPLNLVYTLSENDQYRFNLIAGAGLLSGAKLRGVQGPVELESDSASGFLGQAGFETMWKLSPQFALTARALGRMGSASLDDEDVDASYSGGVLGLGLRASFGGSGGE
jgi:hypothetical protein